MTIYKCEYCNYQTTSKQALSRHQSKKFSCKDAHHHCKKCQRPFYSSTSFYAHQKDCSGVRRTIEEELKEEVEILNRKLEELRITVDKKGTILKIEPVGYGMLHEALLPQVYFGLPGDLLIPEIPITGIIIKFGSTKEPATRIPKHDKDFGGFRLLDSIVSDNFIEIEDKIKDWLKIKGKLIKAKTVNKQSTDGELFVVETQEDYESIVKLAKYFVVGICFWARRYSCVHKGYKPNVFCSIKQMQYENLEKACEHSEICIEKLPPNCTATHLIKMKSHIGVVPIKLLLEPVSRQWNIIDSYQGLLVLWIYSARKCLIIDKSRLQTGRPQTHSLIRSYAQELVNFQDVGNSLTTEFIKAIKMTRDEVMTRTKYRFVSRENIKSKPSTNALEAKAHEELFDLLTGNLTSLTPEQCRADFVYGSGVMQLGCQTKSCTMKTNGKLNTFHKTSGYEGLLLFCRPMIRIYAGTFIIPGELAPKNLQCSLSEKSKYVQYLVPDVYLSSFMNRLYTAIIDREQTFCWPSGKEIPIDSLRLCSFLDYSIPSCPTNRRERENAIWRERLMPYLSYDHPKEQATTVDVIINGVRVQDKVGLKKTRLAGHIVILQKRAGARRTTPYKFGDFDVVFVYASCLDYFWIIPAKELMTHKILTTADQPGKYSIICYTSDHNRKVANAWTSRFCFDVRDTALEKKVVAMFQRVHENVG